ncbi:hypothetical protein Tco_1292305 [Tanacetum coccineum]
MSMERRDEMNGREKSEEEKHARAASEGRDRPVGTGRCRERREERYWGKRTCLLPSSSFSEKKNREKEDDARYRRNNPHARRDAR